jgi:hypothetical protein
MEVLRFYSRDRGNLEYLAKYIAREDRGLPKIKELLEPIVAPIAADEPYDIYNTRLIDLDNRLIEAGLERVDVITGADYDAGCQKTFDAILDPQVRTLMLVAFDIIPTQDPELPYDKRLSEQLLLGSIQ